MKAVLIKDGKGPIENLYIGEVPKSSPQKGQVLVKIKAFGLNRSELSQREGRYPPPPGASEILGLEFSGTIEELGEGVDPEKWKIGDEVMALTDGGAYAEYTSCSSRTLMKKPAHLNWAEAASIPEVYLTAYQALIKIAEFQRNEDALIHAGASGVGIAAIHLARFFGARTVTATASTQAKLDWLLEHGATHVANYKTEDFSEVVKKITEDRGVDVIIDMVGQSHWTRNMNSLARDGRMTILALMSGNIVPQVDLAPILYKRLKIQGSTLRSRTLDYKAALIASFEKEVLDHITNETGDGPLKTYIHRVFPWTEIQTAQREMQDNKNIGKIIAEIA